MELTNIKDGKYTCYIQGSVNSYAFTTLIYSTLCLEVAVADTLRRHSCIVDKTSEYRDMCRQYQNSGVDLIVGMGAASYWVDVKRCYHERMSGDISVGHIKSSTTNLIATIMDGYVYLARPVDLVQYSHPNSFGSNVVSGADFAEASKTLESCNIFPMPLSRTAMKLISIGSSSILSKFNVEHYKTYNPAVQYDALEQMLSDVVCRSGFARQFADLLGVEPEIIPIF